MKKAFIIGVTLVLGVTPSYADVYVKVDAQGNAIGGAIVCDSATCGEGSLYSQLTLGEGERYVLQGLGHTGIGNNNPDTQVKVDIPTQTWTVTTPTQVNTFVPSYEPVDIPVYVPPVVVETSTVISDTATVISDTATVLSDTRTATVSLESVNSFESAIAYIRLLLNQIYAIFEKLGIRVK
jgi:hypothetical protein